MVSGEEPEKIRRIEELLADRVAVGTLGTGKVAAAMERSDLDALHTLNRLSSFC